MSVRRNRRSDECLPLKVRLAHLDRKAAERFPLLGILESQAPFSLKRKKFASTSFCRFVVVLAFSWFTKETVHPDRNSAGNENKCAQLRCTKWKSYTQLSAALGLCGLSMSPSCTPYSLLFFQFFCTLTFSSRPLIKKIVVGLSVKRVFLSHPPDN